jgi:hypothetical protein
MHGFNFQTKKIEEMTNYEVRNYFFDYDNDFNNQTIIEGGNRLEAFFEDIKFSIEDNKNYLIKVKINNETFLDFEEYFTLFAVFGFIMTNGSGVDNNKNYLGVKDEIRQQLAATDYTILKIMNHVYNFGTIQLSIDDNFDTEVLWATTTKS